MSVGIDVQQSALKTLINTDFKSSCVQLSLIQYIYMYRDYYYYRRFV